MTQRILVPVDLDNADKLTDALDAAADIARARDTVVVYVGVVDAAPTSGRRTDAQIAKDRLDAFAAEQAAAHGIRTADHVALRRDLHLHVGREIIETAAEAGCGLIVMASHVPGLKEHVFSSNAGYVASHAPVSVYVVR